ncbi:MAG: transcriptional regulator, partial [Pseudoxanthomonas sp.]
TLGYADIAAALDSVSERVGRDVNPTLYSRSEFDKRLKEGNAFLARVMEQPKIWLIGGKDDLGA